VPPQVAYFGATFAILAIIWLAQGGHAIEGAPGQHDLGAGGKKPESGGADMPVPASSPYSYNTNEQSSQDVSSPYGGTTDNSTSSDSPASVASSTFSGGGIAGGGIRPLGGGIGVGGYVQPSAPVAAAILQNAPTYSGSYQPYTPPASSSYVPGTSSAGGGGALRL
jgi:hypothetical protein